MTPDEVVPRRIDIEDYDNNRTHPKTKDRHRVENTKMVNPNGTEFIPSHDFVRPVGCCGIITEGKIKKIHMKISCVFGECEWDIVEK